MKVKLVKVGTAVGVGAVDEVLEWWDEKAGRTLSFRTATDIGRIVLTLGGYAMQMMDFAPEIGEAMALSSTTLLTKSIAKPVKEAITRSAAVQSPGRKVSIPRSLASPISPASPGRIERSYQPEMERATAF